MQSPRAVLPTSTTLDQIAPERAVVDAETLAGPDLDATAALEDAFRVPRAESVEALLRDSGVLNPHRILRSHSAPCQIGEVGELLPAKSDGPLDQMPQLPHVAGPRIG